MKGPFTGRLVARWLADAGLAAELRGDLDAPARAVATDSRTLPPQACFVALTGPSFDGDRFVADAFAGGAVGAVTRGAVAPPPGGWTIAVPDTLAALQAIAAAWRRRLATPVVAITGSCGKTTTREMVAAIGEAAGIATCASCANHNNEIGVPLTLLALRPHHRLAVVELGMNHPGEIGLLTRLARPDLGAITRIGAAHLAGVGDLDGVVAAKGELVAEMAPGRPVVLNRDDGAFPRLAVAARGPVVAFGRHPEATVRWQRQGEGVEITAGGETAVIDLPPGDHLAEDAACAAACTLALGLPLAAVAAGLGRFHPLAGRGARLPLPGGGELIDESYNANPDSMAAALALLAEAEPPRVAVLGEMFELGTAAAPLHRTLGAQAALACDHLIAVGSHAGEVVAGAGRGEAVADWQAAVVAVRPLLDRHPTLLVKGSHSVHLERLVAAVGEQREVQASTKDAPPPSGRGLGGGRLEGARCRGER